MGPYGATIGVAVAIGLVGGSPTDGSAAVDLYLNIPIGIAAIAVTI
jgi:hypothetical protein